MEKLKLFFKFTFVLLIVSLSSTLFANEIWVKESNIDGTPTREFVSIKKIRRHYQVSIYTQIEGEYQELKEKITIRNKSKFINQLNSLGPVFEKVTSLLPWAKQSSTESLFGGKKNQFIWEAKNQWNEEWDIKFANWIQNEITLDFYKKYNIQTDCADALVGLRWIFARINSLPVANTLADSNDLFGNFSMNKKWKKLDTSELWYQDELFLTALNYVMDLTSTRTVINDGYPIKLDRNGILAGSYIITSNNSSGHAKIISETHFNEVSELPIYTLASTTPRQVRMLTREVFSDQDWPIKKSKDILAFRWPVFNGSEWILKSKESHSRYSEEQYDPNLKNEFNAFILFILSRVKDNYDPIKLVELGTKELASYLGQRINIVQDGYSYCSKNKCDPKSEAYDEWSTPSRDEKLLSKFSDIDKLVMTFEKVSPGLFEFWQDKLRKTKLIIDDFEISLSSIRFLFEEKFTSIDPNQAPATRWGLSYEFTLNDWFLKIEDLLNKRETIISKNITGCSNLCAPKSNLFIELNTFHFDAELSKNYVKIKSYCNVIGIKKCNKFFDKNAVKILKLGNSELSLNQWIERIPFFNADPRNAAELRWGAVDNSTTGRILPYYDTITIASNKLAVLDNRKLIDLSDGNLLIETTVDSRLILTSSGEVLRISDLTNSIERMIYNRTNGVTFWKPIVDTDNILTENVNRRVSYTENDEVGLFKIATANSIIFFKISNDQVLFVDEVKDYNITKSSLILALKAPNEIDFIELNKTKIVKLIIPLTDELRNLNKLEISSYDYPNVILNYRDQDWGLSGSYLVNLETKSWNKIKLPTDANIVLNWSSARFMKGFYLQNANAETTTLFAFKLSSNGEIVSYKLLNNLIEAHELGQDIIFLQSEGHQWGTPIHKEAWKFNSDGLSKLDFLNLKKPEFLSSKGIYFNEATRSDDYQSGYLVDYHGNLVSKMPSFLSPLNDFYQLQIGSRDFLSYRFDVQYGDYWNMGGLINYQHLANNHQDNKLIFTFYAWLNRENLLDVRWQEAFKKSTVMVGTLVNIGRNISVWLDNSK